VTYAVLAWLGLAFGSFINALVWRLHEQSKKSARSKKPSLSILKGRSMCPNCRHPLALIDLIPVLSWLALKGKCRHCHKKISWQYPAVELAGAAVFTLSYAFWPAELQSAGQWLLFIDWLVVSVGLLALLVYDFRWMLLPSRLIYPTAAVAVTGRLAYIVGFETDRWQALLMWLLALGVASGIFWLLFEISKGKWIGFGDVRLGLITGTVLATPPKAFLMIFMASVLGTILVLPALITGRKSMTSRLPYGPFLIVATWLTMLFGDQILERYRGFFIY